MAAAAPLKRKKVSEAPPANPWAALKAGNEAVIN